MEVASPCGVPVMTERHPLKRMANAMVSGRILTGLLGKQSDNIVNAEYGKDGSEEERPADLTP